MIFFQNFKFQFLSTTMKIPKKFEKISSCSKKFKWYRKLNDGSLGYWEKSCWVSNLLLRFLKLHLKIFLKALFLQLLGLFRFSENHCRHMLWSIGLKLAHMKDHMPGYIQCENFFDTTNGWFFRRGVVFPGGHTVIRNATDESIVSYSCPNSHDSKVHMNLYLK